MENRFLQEIIKLSRILLVAVSILLIGIACVLIFIPEVFFEILRGIAIAVCIGVALLLIGSFISLAISAGKRKKKDRIG